MKYELRSLYIKNPFLERLQYFLFNMIKPEACSHALLAVEIPPS